MVDSNLVLSVFSMYSELKLHFNNPKVFYSGKMHKNSWDDKSMNKRNDVDMFVRLSDIYQHDLPELKERYITLFLKNKRGHISEMLDISFDKLHNERMKRIMNLSSYIENDATRVSDYLFVEKIELSDILKCNNERPLLIKKLRLSDEFLSLLDLYHSYLQQETENPAWKKRSFSLFKYKYLIPTFNGKVESIMSKL